MALIIEKTAHEGVFLVVKDKRRILVTQAQKGVMPLFSEHIYDEQYREWTPKRSKVAAAIMKRLPNLYIKKGSYVLYLGASHGYTCSFLADIVGPTGAIFGVEFAQRTMRDFLMVAKAKENIIPLFADARKIKEYQNNILPSDVLIQDVAQPDQVRIFVENLKLVKAKGYGLLALKTRSIDVTKSPRQIAREVEEQLKKEVRIISIIDLIPFQKDHFMFVCQKKD